MWKGELKIFVLIFDKVISPDIIYVNVFTFQNVMNDTVDAVTDDLQ